MKIDTHGKLALEFGRKGSGPGEMLSPRSIMTQKNLVYVFDPPAQNLLCFDSLGQLQKQQKLGGINTDLAKTSNG